MAATLQTRREQVSLNFENFLPLFSNSKLREKIPLFSTSTSNSGLVPLGFLQLLTLVIDGYTGNKMAYLCSMCLKSKRYDKFPSDAVAKDTCNTCLKKSVFEIPAPTTSMLSKKNLDKLQAVPISRKRVTNTNKAAKEDTPTKLVGSKRSYFGALAEEETKATPPLLQLEPIRDSEDMVDAGNTTMVSQFEISAMIEPK